MKMEEKKGPVIDPKRRYLIQEGGTLYPYDAKLAKRKDMKEYFHETGSHVDPANAPRLAVKRVPIMLQDKEFQVEEDLFNTLSEMGAIFTTMQQENKVLKEEKEAFEAAKERLDTDIFDLTGQLKEANAKIAELSKPAEAEQPEKKGKK
jgi:hypothetical protein